MTGYKNIAVVNLLEDYNKKDYAFALYDEDCEVLNSIKKLKVTKPTKMNTNTFIPVTASEFWKISMLFLFYIP